MPRSLDRLLVLALALMVTGPPTVSAAHAAPRAAAADVDPSDAADDTAQDEPQDDVDDAPADDADAGVDPEDAEEDAAAEAAAAGDDSQDSGYDSESTSGSTGSSGKAATPLVMSLDAFLKTGRLNAPAITVPSAVVVVRELTLTPGTTSKTMRPWRSVQLAKARRAVSRAGSIHVPLLLTAAGRKALHRAGQVVRVTVRTTMRPTSGPARTSTLVVVLRRGSASTS